MENEFSCLEDLGSGQVGEAATYSDLFYHFYGQGGYEGTMAQLRYKLMAENAASGCNLPPTESVLSNHIKRAHLQVNTWHQADVGIMDVLSPQDHGWMLKDGLLHPDFNVKRVGSVKSCKCLPGCKTVRCPCKKPGLNCNDSCRCKECVNVPYKE